MFKVSNKDVNGVVLVSLSLTLNIFTPSSSVSIVNFEHVIAGWDTMFAQCPVEQSELYEQNRSQRSNILDWWLMSLEMKISVALES